MLVNSISTGGNDLKPFYADPILNSPYHPPTRHHALGDDGQPLEHEAIRGRRRSRYMVPVPLSKKQSARAGQGELGFDNQVGTTRYSENSIVNEIRSHLEAWRNLGHRQNAWQWSDAAGGAARGAPGVQLATH